MGKITWLARTSLFILILFIGSSFSFFTAKLSKAAGITISGSVTDVLCSGQNSGSISLSISGGTGPYSFSWDGPNAYASTTQSPTDLYAGNYNVTVTDANNNTASSPFTVEQPNPLQISSPSSNAVSCNGQNDGTITAGSISGGISPYLYQLNSGSFGSSNSFTGLTAGNYTITVKDSNGCTATSSIEVTEPAMLTMQAATATPVSCNGESDGTITAGSVSGGNSNYQYSINGSTFQPSNSFSGLAAGNYTVTVKDEKGCTATVSVEVTEPAVLTMQAATATPVSCNGQSDGTITAGNVTGGNANYQYSIDGNTFHSSNSFSGLAAGNYTVTVKDEKGCTATSSVEVIQPAILTMQQATSTDVSCNGESDGTITAGSVSGGNSNYQYSINGSTFQNATTFSGLAAGDYTLTVKDDKGCTATASVELTQPAVLNMQAATATSVSCNGESDGTITAGSVSGGNPNYQYSINGNTFQSSNSFSGLAAGNYTVTVKDEKGCTATASVEVTQPAVLTMLDPTFTPVGCNGNSDGTVTVGDASGGNGNYQYSIDGITFDTSKTFTNLSAKTYTVTVQDSKGCTYQKDITVTQPNALSIAASSSTEVTCNGGNDGTITAGTVTGGNSNYEYSLDNTNFQSSNYFAGIAAGNYTIFVKDSKGCSLQSTITVSQPEKLTASLSKTNVSCFGNNSGIIKFSNPSGGHGSYEYSVDGSNWQSGKTFSNLSSGNYQVSIRDAGNTGCIVVLNSALQITQPSAALTATVNTTRTTTYGTATGSATANPTGGTAGYTYSWKKEGENQVLQATKTAKNLSAGNYVLTVSDKNGCAFTKTVTIVDAILANIIPTSICEDDESGIRNSYFEVEDKSAKGGVGPYTYQWNFGANATPATATGPGAHRITYSVTGNKTITLVVTDNTGISKTFTYVQYVGECFRNNCGSNDFALESYYVGDSNGNKVTSVSCLIPGQKYIYINIPSGPTRYSLYVEINYSITNLITGEVEHQQVGECFYSKEAIPNQAKTFPIDWNCGDKITVDNIYLTFSNNKKWTCGQGPNPKCYSTNSEEIVESPLYAKADPNTLLCNGSTDGTIDVTATGGIPPYDYSITSANSGFQIESKFQNLTGGTYTVWVRDSEGTIFETDPKTISEPTNPISLEITPTNPICFGELGSATVTATGGTPFETGEPYHYLWNDATEQTTATATNLEAGDYTVTVIDANGCQTIGSVSITQPEELTQAEAGEDQSFKCGTITTTLHANSPETGNGVWSIISGSGGNIEEPTNPGSVFTGKNDTYILRWTISNADNTCSNYDEVSVTFEDDCSKLDFDGIDDYVLFDNSYGLTSGNFTIEAWVKLNSTDGTKTVLSKRNSNDFSTGGYDLVVNSGAPTFRWGNKSISTSYKLSTQRWYHLAVVYDGSNFKLYVDGINVGNTAGSNLAAIDSPFLIGAMYNPDTPTVPANYFHGWIQEVRIWTTNLNEEQLHFIMNQQLEVNANPVKGTVLPLKVPGDINWSSLAGYYPLLITDITSGFTPDKATNKVDGELKNIETLQETTAPLPYISKNNGVWSDRNTWLHPDVWDWPNATGINGDKIDWNIAKISYNITSGGQDIELLGLLSESNELKMANPNEASDENNNGQALTITHYLDLDGVINLEGESQLIQTDINDPDTKQSIVSIIDANSTGYLTRDQQGTASSFNYNYWTSPVVPETNSLNSTYTIAGVMMDGTAIDKPKPLDFGYQYAYADGGYATPRKISGYWLYKFKGTANKYSDWEYVGSTGTLNVGEGYTMKGTAGNASIADRQNYTFKGLPNNGNITLNVGVGQNYLLGNPYPSAIDINAFIKDNLKDVNGGQNSSNVFNGAIYFWDHFGSYTHYLAKYVGGYATRNLIGGVPAVATDDRINATNQKGTKIPGRYMPVAQGFFINTGIDSTYSVSFNIGGGNIMFKNSQRVFARESTNDSQFLMSENADKKAKAEKDTRSKIRLAFISPGKYHRQILVGVDPNTTNGFDLGYDAPLNGNNAEDMFWIISGNKFVIQGVPNIDPDQVLPLGVKIEQMGTMTIQIDSLENMPEDVKIYLKDKEQETYTDLRKKDFSFEIDKGEFYDRFELVFKDSTSVEEENPGETDTTPDPDESSETGGDPGTGENSGSDSNTNVGGNGGTENPEENGGLQKPVGLTFDVIYLSNDKEFAIVNPDEVNVIRVVIYNLIGEHLQEYNQVGNAKEIRLPVKEYPSTVYVVKLYTDAGAVSKNIMISR